MAVFVLGVVAPPSLTPGQLADVLLPLLLPRLTSAVVRVAAVASAGNVRAFARAYGLGADTAARPSGLIDVSDALAVVGPGWEGLVEEATRAGRAVRRLAAGR